MWGVQAAAFGWLIGAFVQMAIQLPGIKGMRFRLMLNWRQPAVRQIVLLYIPVLFSLVIDTLVVRLFSYNLATNSGIVGSIGIMTWATTLIQFPQGWWRPRSVSPFCHTRARAIRINTQRACRWTILALLERTQPAGNRLETHSV
jgi:hypothetical protein